MSIQRYKVAETGLGYPTLHESDTGVAVLYEDHLREISYWQNALAVQARRIETVKQHLQEFLF